MLIAAVTLSWNINKPFWGHHDWNGVYWGAVARNYVRYGVLTTKLAMVPGNGVVSSDKLEYSFHYAPLFPLIWAAFLAVFGISEWSSRLMSISFSLGTIVVFYLLVKKFFDSKTAFLAVIFWMVTPMFLYFGKMPVHEIPLMFFVLLAFYFYLLGRFKHLLFSTIVAMLITWPGYFIVPAVTFHWFLFKKFRTIKMKQIFILWLSCFVMFALFLLHDDLVTGSFIGGGVKEIFLSRIGGVALMPYVSLLIRWSWTYYFLLLPLSVIWLVKRGKRFDIPILFLIFAVIYPLVFRDASFRHDYLLIYFWPFLALASARFIRFVPLGFILAIVILVARWPYTKALVTSDLYRVSVEVGKKIGPKTSPTDQVLVVSQDPNVPFDAWFVGFYADRITSVIYQGTPVFGDYDKVFYYFSDGSIKTGETISNNGIK